MAQLYKGSGVTLEQPDFEYWQQFYPRGVGDSAFSSPAWQRLMARTLADNARLRFLRIDGPRRPLTIPVFVRTVRFGRYDVGVLPVAYYVTPIETAQLDPNEIEAVVGAVANARFTSFTWWLPPWVRLPELTSQHRGIGRLDLRRHDTYLISMAKTAADHIATRLSSRLRKYLRSKKVALRIVRNPGPALRREYYELYTRVYRERGWQGPRYTPAFFDAAATTLGEGGELVVALTERGRVVGGGVMLYDRFAVHEFQGTVDRATREVRPQLALDRYALQEAERRGLRRVNLGGTNSGNEGLVQAKKAWGAVPTSVPGIYWRSGPRLLFDRVRQGAARLGTSP